MVSRNNSPVDSPFESFDDLFARIGVPFPRQTSTQSGMTIDVEQDDDEVFVTADLPGYSEDDITLQCDGRQLLIRAERQMESDGTYHRRERQSTIERVVRLPNRVDQTDATATHTNGVLSATLPIT